MKTQFVFNGRKYLSPSKEESKRFLDFWDGWASKIHPLQTTWNLTTIERAAGWIPIPVIDDDKIEYSK